MIGRAKLSRANMDTWLAIPIIIAVVCVKYVWDIPTEEAFPYKIIYRCLYLYGVISYTTVRILSFFNGKSFGANYRTFQKALVAGPRESKKVPNVSEKTTEFDGVEVRLFQNMHTAQDGGRPAVIFIHGGGYVLETSDVYDNFLGLICKELDHCVVSIHYTLAPEGKFPKAYDDCMTACYWFIRNSQSFSVDPERIVISGDSAGGQIAASVVQGLCKDHSIPKPKGQVLLYPCLQFLDMRTPSYQRTRWLHGERWGILNHLTVTLFLSFYLFGEENSRFVEAVSGNRHVSSEYRSSEDMKRLDHEFIPQRLKFQSYLPPSEINDDEDNDDALWEETKNMLIDYRLSPIMGQLEGLPTSYVVTCGVDVFRDDAILYCRNLKEANVSVIHKHYESSFHGVITFPRSIIPAAGDMMDDLLSFLREKI